MGIPVGSTKVVLSGVLPGGEIWNTGFWIFGATLDSTAMGNAANAIFTIFNQTSGTHFIPAWKSKFSQPNAGWNAVTLYNYQDTSGHATTMGQKIGTMVPGGPAISLPDTTSLVVTLRTALSGARHRGRMYIPAPGGNVDGNGLFSGTDIQALLDGLKADMQAVQAEPHFAGMPIVVISRVDTTHTQVTTLTADARPDVQRRRANRQNRGSIYSSAL